MRQIYVSRLNYNYRGTFITKERRNGAFGCNTQVDVVL